MFCLVLNLPFRPLRDRLGWLRGEPPPSPVPLPWATRHEPDAASATALPMPFPQWTSS